MAAASKEGTRSLPSPNKRGDRGEEGDRRDMGEEAFALNTTLRIRATVSSAQGSCSSGDAPPLALLLVLRCRMRACTWDAARAGAAPSTT